MEFTYDSYKNMISLLKKEKYKFCNYENYLNKTKCIILRHDIDMNLEKAVEFAEMEKELGVYATYFILMTSDFYNICSKRNVEAICKIKQLGHNIGLHFDEVKYEKKSIDELKEHILKEANLMEEILEFPITSMSMHRPSKEIIEANLKFDCLINSYGKEFMKTFKYVSDSRMNWREPVEEIITSRQYAKLHILTHPIWYGQKKETVSEKLNEFLNQAYDERYQRLNENFRNLQEVLPYETDKKNMGDGGSDTTITS